MTWANCYCVQPLAFLACEMASLRSCGIDGARVKNKGTFVVVLLVHDFGDIFGI
jgi:hypothetical protein